MAKSFQFLTLEEATAPTEPGIYEHIVNSWWITHPENGLALFQLYSGHPWHPQCNPDKKIVEAMVKTFSYGWEPAMVYLESAWVPINGKR